jgi:hypothetical protein
MLKPIYFLLLSLLVFCSCTNYGKKTSKGHISTYYKEGITESQALRASNIMFYIDSISNNPKTEKNFQLIKQQDSICFRMIVAQEKMKDITDDDFLAIGNIISDSVFNGYPVNLDLTDNVFKTIKHLSYKKINYLGE